MKKPYKPTRIIVGYQMKKQLRGGYKILEYSRMSDDTSHKRRVLHKDLLLTDAEDIIYRLEAKLN